MDNRNKVSAGGIQNFNRAGMKMPKAIINSLNNFNAAHYYKKHQERLTQQVAENRKVFGIGIDDQSKENED